MPCLLDRFHPALVVVDVVDDHRAWPGVSEEEEQNLTRNYRDLLSLADIAMANCEPVQKAMHGFCPDIRLVPNGCHSDPPRASPASGTQFDAFQSYAGKTIGYAGNLETKNAIALLSRVADRFRDCQAVLFGSPHANPAVLGLPRPPTVPFPGLVPFHQLGSRPSNLVFARIAPSEL